MSANSFLNHHVDHDPEDANARWRAYLSLMRRTGTINGMSGLDDESEPPDEQVCSNTTGKENGWAAAEDVTAFHDRQAERTTHADQRPEESVEASSLGASSPDDEGLVLDQPRSLRRRAPLYLVAGAFLFLAGFSVGVLRYERRDEPPQFETLAKLQPIGRPLNQPPPPEQEPRAAEQAHEGGPIADASASPVAMSLKHDVSLGSRPALVSEGLGRRHLHKARHRVHAKRVCAHCRVEANDAPLAPLPPIWPDGETLDIPPP